MSDDLILDFPSLRNDADDFLESVTYIVTADYFQNKLKVTHIITGQSFISHLIKQKKAKFSVSLYFKDSAERQNCTCDDFTPDKDKIIAIQSIPIEFSYAPEITPNIVISKDEKIIVNKNSGLSDFWNQGEILKIPKYTRIAHHEKLDFSSGDVSKLISPIYDKNLPDGAMKVEVSATAGETEKAVTVKCAKNIYDELKNITIGTRENPSNERDYFRLAIMTQILCGMYGEIKNLSLDDITNNGLLMHLEELKDKTQENWDDNPDFNPSLAATKMFPYIVSASKGSE